MDIITRKHEIPLNAGTEEPILKEILVEKEKHEHHHHHDVKVSYSEAMKMDAVYRLKASLLEIKEYSPAPSLDTIASCESFVKNGGDINSYDSYGYTQVHYAIRRGRLNVLKWLLANDGDVTKPTLKRGSLALHLTIESGNLKMMHFLVSRGADPNKGDFKGRTPLHWAARYARVLNLVYLLQLPRVDVNQVDHQGRTACHWAVIDGNNQSLTILQYLLDYNLDVTIQDNRGMTPVHWAAASGTNFTHMLIEKDAAVLYKKCHMGKTPREHALLSGHEELALFLLNYEKQRRFLPKYWVNYRFELATFFWIFAYFFAFTYAHFVISFGMFFFLLFLIGQQRKSMIKKSNRLYVAIWYAGNLITVSTVLGIIIPSMTNWISVCLYLIGHYSALHFFYKARTTPPGYLKGVLSDIVEIWGVMSNNNLDVNHIFHRYCLTCLIKRTDRAKHCGYCGKCCHKFDHHCAWIDTCVGVNNHWFFFSFIWVMFIGQQYLVYFLIQYLINQPTVYSETGLLNITLAMYSNYPWILCLLLLHLLFLPFVATISFTQLFVLFYGVTTNEWINRSRYRYLRDENNHFFNPYSKGFFGNFYELIWPDFSYVPK